MDETRGSTDSSSIPDPNDSPLKLMPNTQIEHTAEPMFKVGQESFKEIAQSLLINMQNARNIENGIVAFLPLSSDECRDTLLRVQGHSQEIYKLCNSIYQQIALPAFTK